MPAPCPERQAAKETGQKRYFTGAPCIRGHVDHRYASTTVCVTCHNERGKRVRQENPERHKQYVRAYHERNPGWWRTWQQENRDKTREIARRHRERHPEKTGAVAKRWRLDNPEEYAAYQAQWRLENRGRLNAYQTARNICKQHATPAFGQEGIQFLYEMAADLGLTVDHEVPLKHSRVCGLHVISNLRLLSKAENSRKHNLWEGTR